MRPRALPLIASSLVVGLGLAGCAASPASSDSSSDSGGISIVTSTDVYGDIAQTIAGQDATVTSFIQNSSQDPHSYEATAQDQLAISKADIVIENGGGYDPFIDTMLSSADSNAVVLNAVDITGLESDATAGEGVFNEHVWYNLDTIDLVAKAIADELAKADSANAQTYEDNYTAFAAQVATLQSTEATLKSSLNGEGVAITEPVPLYMLEAVGLVNQTPAAFSEAIEEGTDVSPTVLQEMLDLFGSGEVKMLAYNNQTSGPETQQVESAAQAAAVPVVGFTETLPDGSDYIGWMTDNLNAISAALN